MATDFTANKSLNITTGFTASKYIEKLSCTTNEGIWGISPALASCTAANGWTGQAAGSDTDTAKKLNTVKHSFANTETTADLAKASLAIVKTGYKTTLAAVYSKISTAELMIATVSDLTGAMSLASAAAGAIALAMAF